MFVKYESFENLGHKSVKPLIGSYIASEKIHGSNVSVVVKEGEIIVCKRTAPLSEDEKFFNAQEFMMKYFVAFEKLQKKIGNFQIYGELFGGTIQPKVQYGDEIRWIAFDLYSFANDHYINIMELHELCNSYNIPVCQILKSGSFEEMIALDPIFISNYGFNNQLAEGYVIRHMDSHFMVKHKNDKFLHRLCSIPNPNPNPKPNKSNSDPIEEHLYLKEYVNESIFGNVISKLNETERLNKGLLIKNMKDDIIGNYELNLNDQQMKYLNRAVVTFINEHI